MKKPIALATAVAALVCLLAFGPSLRIATAQAPATAAHPTPVFWLGAVDPVVQRDRKTPHPADYLQLFGTPVAWPTVAARLSGFEISTQLVMRGTPEEQRTVLDGLRARNIALAGQFGVVVQSPDPACGGLMEGMGGPANAAGVAKRLRDIGGRLDYLDMDEPVTFGHESPRNRCPQPIAQLAAAAAERVASYRAQFPEMRVNLIDAVGSRAPTAVRDEVLFVDALGRRGVHLDFFIADVQWATDWQPTFEQLATKLHARGIKVGLYCDGRITANSDAEWDRDSVANCRAAGRDPQIAPDLYMIGSWSRYPTRVLPETEPGTLTHIGKEIMAAFP